MLRVTQSCVAVPEYREQLLLLSMWLIFSWVLSLSSVRLVSLRSTTWWQSYSAAIMFIYKEHVSLYSWFQALFSTLHPSEIISKHLFKSNSFPPFGFFVPIALLFPWMLATLPPVMLHTSQSNSDSATARLSPQSPSSQWRQVRLRWRLLLLQLYGLERNVLFLTIYSSICLVWNPNIIFYKSNNKTWHL